MTKRLLRKMPPWLATAVVAGAILYLTLVPQPLPQADIPLFPGADKVVHGLMFCALTMALLFDWRLWRRRGPTLAAALVLALLSAAFGGVIEVLQGAMGLGRSAEAADFLADVTGAFLPLLFFLRRGRRRLP